MASLTQYTGGNVSNDGTTIAIWVGTENEYDALWSNGDGTGTFNGDAHTIYHITENP